MIFWKFVQALQKTTMGDLVLTGEPENIRGYFVIFVGFILLYEAVTIIPYLGDTFMTVGGSSGYQLSWIQYYY